VVGMAGPARTARRRERGSGPRLVDGTGDPFPVPAPILLHGDPAFRRAGRGGRDPQPGPASPGYRTRWDRHVSYTQPTRVHHAPEAARSTVYPTDVARWSRPRSSTSRRRPRGVPVRACPVWPSASARRFSPRTSSSTSVCLPSPATPQRRQTTELHPTGVNVSLIDAKRSVRKLYTEALVAAGRHLAGGGPSRPRRLLGAAPGPALDETRRPEPRTPPAAPLTLAE